MTTIDLSLRNKALYKGCVVEEVAGRLNLKTPVAEAVVLIGRNIAANQSRPFFDGRLKVQTPCHFFYNTVLIQGCITKRQVYNHFFLLSVFPPGPIPGGLIPQ